MTQRTYLVDSPEVFEQMLAAAGPIGALDIETCMSDLFTETKRLVTIGFTFDGETAWVVPVDHPETPLFRVGRGDLNKLRIILGQTKWIMHNGGFDRLVLEQKGRPVTLKHDTMAMAYLLHESEPKSLEALSEKWLGLPAYKGVDYKNIMDEPLAKIAEMNGEDALRTFNLFRPLADELNKNKDLSRLYQWLLMPAVNALIDVTRNGVPVDRANLEQLTKVVQLAQDKALTWLLAHTPDPDPDVYPDGWPRKRKADPALFNPGSYKQVGHVLYDIFGLHCHKHTDTGNRSTDDDAVTQLLYDEMDDHTKEWVSNLRDYRVLSKQLSAYIDPWPGHIAPDGRMHPQYKPLFVVTGRLSSNNPNIQQVPRHKEFRDVFGGVEGWSWMKADYSQIELRLAAWHAEEETMLQAFQDDQDIHALTAENILGDSSARQIGKTLNFGLLYGAGAKTLQRVARTEYEIALSLEQAKLYRARFFETYPALLQWHRRLEEGITKSGTAISPLGRIRHLPDALRWEDGLRQSAVREGINHPIQSFASDILLMSLVRVVDNLRQAGLGAKVICEVHDEMDLLVPNTELQETGRLVRETMEDLSWMSRWGIKVDVPVFASVEIGSHWGSLNEWRAT